jgi:hypothetical protein
MGLLLLDPRQNSDSMKCLVSSLSPTTGVYNRVKTLRSQPRMAMPFGVPRNQVISLIVQSTKRNVHKSFRHSLQDVGVKHRQTSRAHLPRSSEASVSSFLFQRGVRFENVSALRRNTRLGRMTCDTLRLLQCRLHTSSSGHL